MGAGHDLVFTVQGLQVRSLATSFFWMKFLMEVSRLHTPIYTHYNRRLNYLRMNYRFEKVGLLHCMNIR